MSDSGWTEARERATKAQDAYDQALTELIDANRDLHEIERREFILRFNQPQPADKFG